MSAPVVAPARPREDVDDRALRTLREAVARLRALGDPLADVLERRTDALEREWLAHPCDDCRAETRELCTCDEDGFYDDERPF
jgi:hypothetical protein